MIGKNFGQYRIEAKIGEGGMGVVYRAVDTELDRPVAIKMIQAGGSASGSDGADSVARFMREAKAASRLQHPAIMTIYQFGVQDNARYLVMEFIEGRTLKKIISGRPVPVQQICEIGVQVADGLAVAHEKGVIHRDMKAENVMVTPRGQVKILDFGLAKLRDEANKPSDATVDDYYKTEIGTVLGTVTNMSPEQALGNEVDDRTDIFSLGVIFYEMATGKSPFIGPSPQATMARVLNQEPPLASEVNPAIVPNLEKLIHQCLRKEARFRPSAKEVTEEIKRIQATLSARDYVAGEIRAEAFGAAAATGSGSHIPGVSSSSPAIEIRPALNKNGAAATPGSGVKRDDRKPAGPQMHYVYKAVKALRWALSIATVTIPLSFFLYMLVSAGIVRGEVVEGTWLWNYVKAIVVPALALAEKVFTFRPVYNGWNLMLAGLGIAGFALRQAVLLPVEQAEHWLKTRLLKSRTITPGAAEATVKQREMSHRLSVLREYNEAQNYLAQGRRHLAFLSVDVVGSTKMKQGEDKLVIEHAFSEYKKFIERILKTHNAWKTAFTPDGIMSAFAAAEDAVRAGQAVLNELPWFNDGIHSLRTPFSVRCGVNTGEVIFPEERLMEDITDEVIDVAGHMQKYAAHGTLWISQEGLRELAEKDDFHAISTQQVDGRTPFEWRPVLAPKSSARLEV